LAATLWRSVAEAILTTDAEGVITHLNPAAEKLFALSVADAVDRSLRAGALNPELGRSLAQAVRDEITQPLTFDLEVYERSFAATLAPVLDEASARAGWVFLLQDVTHLRQAEQWRGEAVQTAAHDLRNPLNLMAGSVNLLAETLPALTPDQAECLAMLRTGMERMNALIEQLLKLEEVDATPTFNRARVSLRRLLAASVEEFRRAAEEKALRLTFEGALSEAVVWGDEVLLQRAAANLLGNALKSTPAGGRITVRCREADGAAICEVQDTGLGVPVDTQPHLFERFYRVKSAATRQIPGSGLGLAIVKTIIEKHGGRVWVSSEEGQGSTFGFSIPLGQQATSA
jgi:two-component system phosphate regulon sensor histidine kinase PhoR